MPPYEIDADIEASLRDRYEIVRELGSGGAATVYLARDVRHERHVAIKLMRPELTAVSGADRFQREIRIAAALRHSNILPLFDSGEANGVSFYVMPFIEGETLRARLQRERQLPIPEALRITSAIAEALGYAHERRIVHRDIKPENILLSGSEVYVADFGVARALMGDGGGSSSAGTGPRTSTGVAVGTPLYMSPEQASADPDVDGRSDIYSLGCVLYELLAGDPPYSGSSMAAIIARHVNAPIPNVTIVRPTVPPQLQHLVETTLNKSPADRFQTASELSVALGDVGNALQGLRNSGSATLIGPSAAPNIGSTATGVRSQTTPGAPATTRDGTTIPSRRRWATPLAAAVTLLAALGAWWNFGRGARTPTSDPALLFIAPFNVVGLPPEEWRQGLADLITPSLDGAGFRVVPFTANTIRDLGTRVDDASSLAAAQRSGAGRALLATAQKIGVDSVRVTATLIDLRDISAKQQFAVTGHGARLDLVADSLSVGLLRRLVPERVEISRVPRSVLALSAYVRGEYFFRRAEYDSAQIYFSRAAADDSTFAMAHSRLSTVALRLGANGGNFVERGLLAGRLNHQQSPRDSLLIAIDSQMVAFYNRSNIADSLGRDLSRRMLATLDVATTRYPADPEFWYREALYRANAAEARDRVGARILEALDNTIAIDSTFALAYNESLSISMRVNGAKDCMRHIDAYLRRVPNVKGADGLRLLRELLESPPLSDADFDARASKVSPQGVLAAFNAAIEWPDSSLSAVRLARRLARDPKASIELGGEPGFGRSLLLTALAYRGRVADAYAARTDKAHFELLQLAFLGAISPDSAVRTFSAEVREPVSPRSDVTLVLPLLFMNGDSATLRVLAERADSLGRATPEGETRQFARYLSTASGALIALVRHDSAAALQKFLALDDVACARCDALKVVRVKLLRAMGRHAEARQYLTDEMDLIDRPLEHVWTLERAHNAAALGDVAKARKLFARALAFLPEPQGAFEPMIRDARKTLSALPHAANP